MVSTQGAANIHFKHPFENLIDIFTKKHRHIAERHATALGGEFQLPQTLLDHGVSNFAEHRIGEDDYKGIWAGARIYLGDSKSLLRRHREDDPRN